LREAGIDVHTFDADLVPLIEEMNRDFSRQHRIGEIQKLAPAHVDPSAVVQPLKGKGTFSAGSGSTKLGDAHDDYIESWVIVTFTPLHVEHSVGDLFAASVAAQTALPDRVTQFSIESWSGRVHQVDAVFRVWKPFDMTSDLYAGRSGEIAMLAIANKLLALGYSAVR
jgi:hypothetical protein